MLFGHALNQKKVRLNIFHIHSIILIAKDELDLNFEIVKEFFKKLFFVEMSFCEISTDNLELICNSSSSIE